MGLRPSCFQDKHFAQWATSPVIVIWNLTQSYPFLPLKIKPSFPHVHPVSIEVPGSSLQLCARREVHPGPSDKPFCLLCNFQPREWEASDGEPPWLCTAFLRDAVCTHQWPCVACPQLAPLGLLFAFWWCSQTSYSSQTLAAPGHDIDFQILWSGCISQQNLGLKVLFLQKPSCRIFFFKEIKPTLVFLKRWVPRKKWKEINVDYVPLKLHLKKLCQRSLLSVETKWNAEPETTAEYIKRKPGNNLVWEGLWVHLHLAREEGSKCTVEGGGGSRQAPGRPKCTWSKMISSSPCFQNDFCERHPIRSRACPRLLSPISGGKVVPWERYRLAFHVHVTHLQWACQRLLANHRSQPRFWHLSVLLRNGRCRQNQSVTGFPLSSPLYCACAFCLPT